MMKWSPAITLDKLLLRFLTQLNTSKLDELDMECCGQLMRNEITNDLEEFKRKARLYTKLYAK